MRLLKQITGDNSLRSYCFTRVTISLVIFVKVLLIHFNRLKRYFKDSKIFGCCNPLNLCPSDTCLC